MSNTNEVIGILCADVHFSHKTPLLRSAEPDWYDAQARTWEQVNELSDHHDCPIIIAGDVVHSWRENAECVNFVLSILNRNTYAISGNHDSPHHRAEDIHKSPYWTLVAAGKIIDLPANTPRSTKAGMLHGFPHGTPVEPWIGGSIDPFGLRIAVVHDYLWSAKSNTGHTDAPEDKLVGSHVQRLGGFDVAVFGDNHQPLDYRRGGLTVFNAGLLQRRRSDEMGIDPSVGLLHPDGRVSRHFLDTSQDKYLTPAQALEVAETPRDFGHLVEELSSLGESSVDFVEAVTQRLRAVKLPESVEQMVLKILDQAREKR